jgi:hypothetical protein
MDHDLASFMGKDTSTHTPQSVLIEWREAKRFDYLKEHSYNWAGQPEIEQLAAKYLCIPASSAPACYVYD